MSLFFTIAVSLLQLQSAAWSLLKLLHVQLSCQNDGIKKDNKYYCYMLSNRDGDHNGNT